MGTLCFTGKLRWRLANKLVGKKIPVEEDASKASSRIKRVRYYKRKLDKSRLIKYTNKWIDEWNEFSGNNFAPENASLQSIWINFQNQKNLILNMCMEMQIYLLLYILRFHNI